MTHIPEDAQELERIGVELTEEERFRKPTRCEFLSVCGSPSKSLDWACGTRNREQSCIAWYVLRAKLQKEEKERLRE